MMLDTTYISRTGDGSLEDRIRDYLEALSAFENMKSSKPLANDPKWVDTLGDADDINQAQKIIDQSLHHATGMIDDGELELALSKGLLSKEQTVEFSKLKVQLDFEKQTTGSKQSQADKLGHKQKI